MYSLGFFSPARTPKNRVKKKPNQTWSISIKRCENWLLFPICLSHLSNLDACHQCSYWCLVNFFSASFHYIVLAFYRHDILVVSYLCVTLDPVTGSDFVFHCRFPCLTSHWKFSMLFLFGWFLDRIGICKHVYSTTSSPSLPHSLLISKC